MDKPTLAPALLAELHVLGYRHWTRLAVFAGLYLVAGSGACLLAGALTDMRAALLIGLPFYVVAGASLHGISLFTHEGVHGTLSRRPGVNRAVSVLCALPVLQNFAAYRVLHLRHHNHLGLPGDPDHYPNYTRWTWLQFTLYWGRLLIGYPVYITAIPLLGFRHGSRADRAWIALEVGLILVVATALLVSGLPWLVLVHAWLIPMIVINTLVNIRGMSQHTLLEDATDPILGTRSILTNPVTRFFMCNENYHLEHHLYPGVPWYNLRRLHQLLRDELTARGAPVIPSYFAFVRAFVVGSCQRCPLGTGAPVVEPADPLPRLVAGGIYLHEGALLALGIGTLGLLVIVAGVIHKASVEVALATALYAAALIGLRGPAAWPDRARFVVTYWYIVWFFSAVARITPALGTPLRDAPLYALDVALFGGTPAVEWQAYATGWLTELFSAAYLSYFVYLNVAVVYALFQPVACRYRLAAPLVGAYIVGFCGYLLVPAVGPAVALAGDFAQPLSSGVLTRINEALVTQGSSVYDVFPSLHVLITCVLLDHDRRAVRWRFWVMLAPACLLFMSTLYLRYHYAVDVVAGFACFLALRVVNGVLGGSRT